MRLGIGRTLLKRGEALVLGNCKRGIFWLNQLQNLSIHPFDNFTSTGDTWSNKQLVSDSYLYLILSPLAQWNIDFETKKVSLDNSAHGTLSDNNDDDKNVLVATGI